MTSIRTTMPVVKELTPEYRQGIAKLLHRYLPRSNGDFEPHAINDLDGLYVFDNHNDWWCKVDDDDSRVIHISYRHVMTDREREQLFARWVVAWNSGWQLWGKSEKP